MSESVAFYEQQARAGWFDASCKSIKEAALQAFSQRQFPTRHDEDWKYSAPDAFLKHEFTSASSVSPSACPTMALPIDPLYAVTMVNGQLIGLESLASNWPKGVLVLPLSIALETMPARVLPYLGKALTSQHAFHELNTAMLQHGLFIYVPKGVCVADPLWVTHWQDQANQAVYPRHVVVLEAGSRLDLMEEYRGADDVCYFTNTVTEVHLAEDAHLTHYKLQRESRSAFHVGHIAVKQGARSRMDSHLLSLGGQWVRSDMSLYLSEPKASCLLNGLYLPGEGQHMDQHTVVHHDVPDCQSEQDYKGIMKGRSRAVFNGCVIVANDAQHSEAKQQNKNLLLSANAEIDTKPQLEIYADDVVCTHGATVGQLDEDSLFYLATRGIGREEAGRYLMQAFMSENNRLIANANKALGTWVGALVMEQLG